MLKARIVSRLALALLCCLQTSRAHSDVPVRIASPPGLNWDTFLGVIQDGTIDTADAVSLASDTLWASIGNTIAKVDICRRVAAMGDRRTDAFGFNIPVTVVNGSSSGTFSQPLRAVPSGNGVFAVGFPHPDGVHYIRTFWCGDGSFAADTPPPTEDDLDGDNDRGGDGDGADRFSISTRQGQVAVWLPDDIRPGDTISGTVFVEPSGTTPSQRQAHSDTLNGLVIDVAGVSTPVAQQIFRFVVPATSLSAIPLRLRRDRDAAGQIRIPVHPARPIQSSPMPSISQSGRPVSIPGSFDGDFSNTQVRIGGEPAAILAESPRGIVVAAPLEPLGATTIDLVEGQQRVQGALRNVGIELFAQRTNLLRGEHVTLNVRVSGLEGLREALQLTVIATSSIRLQGGNTQTITVLPQQVQSGGLFNVERDIEALAAGGFGIRAMIASQP